MKGSPALAEERVRVVPQATAEEQKEVGLLAKVAPRELPDPLALQVLPRQFPNRAKGEEEGGRETVAYASRVYEG